MKKALLAVWLIGLLTTAASAKVHDGFKYDGFTTGMSMDTALHRVNAKHYQILDIYDRSGIITPRVKSKALKTISTNPHDKRNARFDLANDENIIVYEDTLFAVPAETILHFDKNRRLWEVEIRVAWTQITKKYNETSFIRKVQRNLDHKYHVNSFAQDYDNYGGIDDAAKREWRINHHSTVWYDHSYNAFRLVYEYRRWSNEDDRHKL